jgi:hypothetical protein
MATSSLNRETVQISGGNDSIVIIKDMGDLPGGRVLDVSGVAAGTAVVRAGHVLYQNAAGDIVPLGVASSGAYDALPEGGEYIGVLKTSVLVSDPRASVLTMGQVNAAASPYPVTDEIKTALKHIQFLY